ncbi:MAG: nucleotide exchange factor GrpE [Desulfuromonadales bacterium]|nr:nucleotide exchange factor GrpE [Desulfuromonadales bacterium]
MSKHRKKEQEGAAAETEAATATETEAAAPEVDPLEAARVEAAKNWDLYLRERAEMENFRKRTQRDKEEFRIFTRKELLLEVLPVLDNLERALSHAGQNGEVQGLLEGVTMTVTQFRKVIEDFGARPIVAVGAPFDANLHQAMAQAETVDQPPGTVVSEFQRGYMLQDRLLRPALVVVAKAPAEPAAESTNQ